MKPTMSEHPELTTLINMNAIFQELKGSVLICFRRNINCLFLKTEANGQQGNALCALPWRVKSTLILFPYAMHELQLTAEQGAALDGNSAVVHCRRRALSLGDNLKK